MIGPAYHNTFVSENGNFCVFLKNVMHSRSHLLTVQRRMVK